MSSFQESFWSSSHIGFLQTNTKSSYLISLRRRGVYAFQIYRRIKAVYECRKVSCMENHISVVSALWGWTRKQLELIMPVKAEGIAAPWWPPNKTSRTIYALTLKRFYVTRKMTVENDHFLIFLMIAAAFSLTKLLASSAGGYCNYFFLIIPFSFPLLK